MTHKCGHSLINENCKNCQEIQDQWYEKLKNKGFEDIEERKFNLLKRYTGVCESFDLGSTQEPNKEIQSSWPETNFKKEEEFLNHPEFDKIIESVFKHKNNALSAKELVKAWQSHCDGASSREIAKEYKISAFCGWYVINKIKELMKIMDLNEIKEEPKESVILRSYNPEIDTPFLFSTWRNAIWFDTHTNNEINPIWFRLKTKQIKLILEKPDIKIKIACLRGNIDQIIGYSVIDDLTIEFVYVKINYRNQGVATLLTKGFKDIVKPETKIGHGILKKKKLVEKGDLNGRNEERIKKETKV